MAKITKPKTGTKKSPKTGKDGKATGTVKRYSNGGKFAAEIPPKIKTGGTKKESE